MPHVGGGSGDDLASSDEIKVFKDEGEEEKPSSENLTELKSSLVTEGEEKNSHLPGQSFPNNKNTHHARPDLNSLFGKSFEHLPHSSPFGYVVSPYPHPNGTLGAVSMANKVAMVPPTHPGSPLPYMVYNTEAFQPPPAHMGIPPVHIDPKTGIPRPPMYPLAAPGQYPHPMFSPEFTQQLPWHTTAMYPLATSGFRSPYAGALPVAASSLPRFSPPTLLPPHHGIAPHPGIPHHALMTPGPKLDITQAHENHRHLVYTVDHKPPLNRITDSSSIGNNTSTSTQNHQNHQQHLDKKKMHIKKPLNAFMLYMKEMRAKVVAECTLKESAAINQILGRRWHSLSREEQAKYYEMARKERQLHMQLYPGWTARDNYAVNNKKKKRKKDKSHDGEGSNPKKCRARFGLDQQSSWCKPCRRKKKCIRYVSGVDNPGDDDNIGSVSSVGSIEAPTPDSKSAEDSDSDNLNVSSELSISSPPVPNTMDSNLAENGVHSNRSPSLHPLSVQHLTQSHCNSLETSEPDQASVVIPQLPTPPSTDSSTAAAPPLLSVT